MCARTSTVTKPIKITANTARLDQLFARAKASGDRYEKSGNKELPVGSQDKLSQAFTATSPNSLAANTNNPGTIASSMSFKREWDSRIEQVGYLLKYNHTIMPPRPAPANRIKPTVNHQDKQPISLSEEMHQMPRVDQLIQSILMIAIGVTPLIFSQRATELFEFPKIIVVYALALCILILLCIKWLRQRSIPLPQGIFIWPAVLLLLWMCITTLTSIHPYTSIVGYYTRFNGGLTSYAAYAILAFSCLEQFISHSNQKQVLLNKLLWSWLIAATITSVWAIFEHFGHDPSCIILRGTFTADCWVEDVQARVFSTFGQPNWLATYLVATLPLIIGMLLTSQNPKQKLAISGAAILSYSAFWYTYSRSGWFGLVTALLLIALAIPWRSLWSQKGWLTGILAICLLVTFSSFNTAALRAETSLSGHGSDTSTGSIRLIVWQGALSLIAHHPLFGTGPGTFAYGFLPYRPAAMNNTTEWNFLYNEAHNQVINTAATLGLPGLFIWLSLFILPAIYLWLGVITNMHWLKNRKKRSLTRGKVELHHNNTLSRISHVLATYLKSHFSKASRGKIWLNQSTVDTDASYLVVTMTLSAGIIGVFISQLFGFAVVMTNLLLFISLAIIVVPLTTIRELKLKNSSLYIFAAASMLCIAAVAYGFFRYTASELLIKQAEGFTFAPATTITKNQTAVNLNPWEPNYRVKLAGSYINNARLNDESPTLLQQADKQLQTAYKLNPHDLIVAKNLTYYYRTMSQIDKSFQAKSLQAAQAARALSPTDADACQTLANLYLDLGYQAQALSQYNELIRLRPTADSYLKRAEYYHRYGPTNLLQQDLETVLQQDPTNTQAKQMLAEIT